MCAVDRMGVSQILHERRQTIIDNLHQAFTRTNATPHNAPDMRNHLVELAEQIIEFLLVEPFEHDQAEAIGASLARVCHADFESLHRMQGLLAQQFIHGLSTDQIIALQPRLATLAGCLAIGFYRHICESTLIKEVSQPTDGKPRHESAEYKQAQGKLKAFETSLSGLLSSMADLVFAFDSKGRFIFHHSPRVDGLYTSPEAFLGKTHSEVMPLRMQVLFAEAVEKNKRGDVAQYEYWLEINDRIRWFAVKMSPVFLGGKYMSSVAVAREITEIKEMQQELQQAHNALERRVERRTARLRVLHEIDRAILAVRSPKAIAETALHHIRRLIPCLGGIVSLLDVASGTIVILAAEINGQLALREAAYLPLDDLNDADGLLESLRQGKTHMLEDTRNVARPSKIIQALQGWNIRSMLSIPLVFEDESIGALSLGMESLGSLAPEDMDIAKEVANSLAVAIQQSRLLEEARTSRARLRRLTQQIISTQEEERRRLSRALHDQTGQALIALKISLGLMQEDLSTNFGSLHRRLGDAVALATTTMEQIRSLAHNLRPPTLDAAGLNPTLEGFCDEFAKHTQLSIVYTGLETFPALSDTTNICFYRFLQEALTNVVKHACASRVHVTLHCDAEMASLAVKDDGHGFDEQTRLSARGWSMGIGLLGMQERLESLGGRLRIESQPGKGACLTAYLPVSEEHLEENR